MNTIEIQNKIATNRDLIDRIVRSEMPILQIKEQIRNLAKQNEKLLIKFNEQMEKQKTSKANLNIGCVSKSGFYCKINLTECYHELNGMCILDGDCVHKTVC